MSFVRVCSLASLPAARRCIAISPALASHRFYASKSKGFESTRRQDKRAPVATNTLVPGSQLRIAEDAQEEFAKCEGKMKTAVEWYRKEVANFEDRASGRVTPALLSPIRVVLPGRGNDPLRLEEIATIGVKDGSTLIITVFEEDSLKHVETALYCAKIPGIIPRRADPRTIHVPVSKPTVDMRTSFHTAAQREAESTRVQLRKLHQASIKKGKYAKHSAELDEFQKLTDKHISEVDKTLLNLKKVMK